MKEEDLGQVDIDGEANARKGKMYIPNWFNVEVKTGVRKARILCQHFGKFTIFLADDPCYKNVIHS